MEKKLKQQKIIKNATALTLGLGLVTSSFSASYFNSPSKVHATTLSNAETILAKLSPEQRQALAKINTEDQSGLFLSPDVNLEKSENVSIIVQFNQKPHKVAVLDAALKGDSLSDADAKKLVDSDHTTFKNDLNTILKTEKNDSASIKIKREFKNTFNGVSMQIPANKIKSLLKSKAVKAIYSNTQVHVEQPVSEATPSTEAVGKGMAAENSFLNINKLHDEGYTGKGVKVAVIDTGVDYNHPDITAAYKGYRAQPGVDPKSIDINSVKGWDFIDNDADPMETTYADWVKAGKPGSADGADYYTEHGTHVSGTIIGQGTNNSDYATNGIAPDADLYVYRVLGPGGSGANDGIIAAIEKAVTDGMDIMNLSLGANYNDPLSPTSIAINNAVLNGVTAVVAAGNAGNGMYTLGNPGNASLALTVGASDVPDQIATMKGRLDNTISDLRLMAKGFADKVETLQGIQYPIVNIGLGTSSEYTGSNKSVAGKVVLIQRGNTTINDKILQAKNRGAVAVIIYNNNPAEGHLPFNLGESTDFIPAFSLTNADGLALAQKISTGSTQFSFSDLGQLTTGGDNLADFSSRGPARITYEIKPEITAPGVSVLSTVPGFVHDHANPANYQYAYERMSGTSMATPATAGIAALLLQAKPDLQPEDVKAILMNTADPLSKPYSVFEVGAGRVDPYKAIHSSIEIKVEEKTPTIINNKEKQIRIDTAALSYGNKAYNGSDINDTRTVTLLNRGEKSKTFNVSVNFQNSLRGSKDAVKNGVTVDTNPTVTLKGISQKKTNVTLTIPKSAEKGIYEGYVVYTNKDNSNETYKIPFGVHYVEQGFESMSNGQQSVSTSLELNQFKNRAMRTTMALKSHMRFIDVVVANAKTGEDLGVVGTLDGIPLNEGVSYTGVLWQGYYYPFTNDTNNPISAKAYAPDEGKYKLKLIGYDDNGKSYTISQDFFVDNQMPKYDVHIDGEKEGNPFIEYKPDQQFIDMTASIYDKNVEVRNAAGFMADQSQNHIWYYYNDIYPTAEMKVDKDGNVKDQIAMLPSRDFLSVMFEGIDEATNDAGQKQYIFIKDSVPYVYGQPNDPTRLNAVLKHPGETVKITLSANNLNNVMKTNYNFTTNNGDTNIVDISLNPEAKKLGGTLSVTSTNPTNTTTKSDVNVTFDGSNGVSGDLPMVDVTLKLTNSNQTNFSYNSSFNNVKTTFTSVDNKVTRPLTYIAPIGIMQDYSKVQGYIHPDGLKGADGLLDKTKDFTTVGGKMTVIDSKGKKYEGTIDKIGQFFVSGLPVTKDDFTIVQDIPGHFTTYDDFKNAYSSVDDTIYGTSKYLGTEVVDNATAGDVNKDNVIDINDALAIQTYWGTNKRSADINFDGTVDAKDFAFVEENYLMQNSTVVNPPKPVKKSKGKTIESIKNELGIQ
ncbi:S8 family serine peptidase [Arthrobacter citreus]|nr:S8 family serine peptidase [Arthrobacter citreus]